MLLRLFLLFMLWLVVRRVFASFRMSRARRQDRFKARPKGQEPSMGPKTKAEKYKDLTQQKVSDADFEEIP